MEHPMKQMKEGNGTALLTAEGLRAQGRTASMSYCSYGSLGWNMTWGAKYTSTHHTLTASAREVMNDTIHTLSYFDEINLASL